MRVAFFGSGAFGRPTLEAIRATCDLVGVISQPDRPAGRGRALTPTPIAAWAMSCAAEVPLFRPERVNEPSVVESLHALEADAWVVIAFGQKLGQRLLADQFAINLHASLLPRWRGAAPINWAILAGDDQTGNSVITLADRMDAGLVLATSTPRAIEPSMSTDHLHDLLAADGPSVVLGVLEQAIRGALRPVVQDESLATHARKLSRDDGWVDFADSARAARCRINGLSPWPGVTVRYAGESLKLLQARDIDAEAADRAGSAPMEPGCIVDPAHGTVSCGAGLLQLLRVQPAGKAAMSWTDFARGRSIAPGSRLEAGPPAEGAPA